MALYDFKPYKDDQYIGLTAIAKRMNLNRETLLKMHFNPSSPDLSFPMYRTAGEYSHSPWTTSNFLIYEWELRMAKLSYEEVRRELGVRERGRICAFEKLMARWHRVKSPKDIQDERIRKIVQKITEEKPVYPGKPHKKDQAA